MCYNPLTTKYGPKPIVILAWHKSQDAHEEPIMWFARPAVSGNRYVRFGGDPWWTFCMFKKPTKEALMLKEALEKLGIRVLVEVDDGHKHIDLCIPSAKINIEVDGDRHLTDAYQILADLKRSYYSNKNGYDTIHISNDSLNSNLGGIASAIAEASKIRENDKSS